MARALSKVEAELQDHLQEGLLPLSALASRCKVHSGNVVYGGALEVCRFRPG